MEKDNFNRELIEAVDNYLAARRDYAMWYDEFHKIKESTSAKALSKMRKEEALVRTKLGNAERFLIKGAVEFVYPDEVKNES